jgi:glycosyltransferase 2 family protein
VPGNRRTRLAAVGLVLAAGVGLTIWRSPDLGEVADAFGGVRWPLAAAALLANLASVTCHGLVWRLTLRQALRDPLPPLRHVLAAHWIGVLGNLLFPARAGEATRVGVLVRHVDRAGAWAPVAGSALAHRLVEAVPVAVLIVAALAFAPVPGWARTALAVLAAAIACALFLAVLAARRSGEGHEDADEEDGLVGRLRRGLGVVREPLPTALALVAGAAAIGLQLVGLWLVLLAFDLDAGLSAAVLVLVLAELVVLFPLWPGNVGVYQGVIAAGLLPFGVPYSTGLAYGLVTQGLDAAAAAAAGAAGLAVEGAGLERLRGDPEESS